MNEHVKPAFDIEALQAQLEALRKDIEGLAGTLGAGAEHARARMADASESARAQMRQGEEMIEHAARTRPLLTILVAAAIGFILGALVSR